MKWRNCRLGDVLALKRGHDLPGDARHDGDVPVVSSSGITGYHNEAKATGPGVVTGRYGTLGEVYYLEQDYWPLNTALYVVDFKGTHPRFASYFLKNVLRNYQSDKAAVPGIDRNVLHEIRIRAPDPDSEERIAGILSAYDDLIENNRRRMALLEESARLLYREWFVRLRFPGHERTRVVNGVPAGWRSFPLGELCRIRRGASPRPIQAFMDGTVPWFKIGDATASESMFILETAEHVTEEGAARSVLLAAGELIVSNSATCGLPYFTGVAGCIHDGWLHLHTTAAASRELLYLSIGSKRQELVNSVSDGSTQKNLNTDAAARLRIVLPSSSALLGRLDGIIQPVFREIGILARANGQLKAARDLLLPRLMSGELEV